MEIGKKSLITFMGLSFLAGGYMALTHGNSLQATQEVVASELEDEVLEEEFEVLEGFSTFWERISEESHLTMRQFEDGDEVRFGVPVSDLDLIEWEIDDSRFFVGEDYQDLSDEGLRLILNESFIRSELEVDSITHH